MASLSDLQLVILQTEYPYLSTTSDVDIERYFELRNNGKQAQALAIYNSRIVKKYPDSETRAKLIRYYRSKNPKFYDLLAENLILLAENTIEKTKKIILLFIKNIDKLDYNDPYAVIKHAEYLLSILSQNKFQAIEILDKYTQLSKILEFYNEKMEKTASLVRMYVTDSLEILHDFKKDFESKSQKENEQKLKSKSKASKNKQMSLDLSKIKFSKNELNKILIPKQITRTEDIVIAYCLKYWSLTKDTTFERIILLYSRKYKTNHYEIYKTIQLGKEHSQKDEEILHSVLSTVVSGYYYSVSGDLYLQRTWARYKPNLDSPQPIEKPIKEAPQTPSKKPTQVKKTQKVKTPKKKPQVRKARTKIAKPKKQEKLAPVFSANSIASIIRRKTGKTYTVYKELFFKDIRTSIRTVLSSSNQRKVTLFSSKQNDAEEIIFSFLKENYDNPYQNWETSQAKKQVSSLGYKVSQIEPIIDLWISSL